MNDLTPRQAREQLDLAAAAAGRRVPDRRVHALATAGFGVLIGAMLVVSRLAEGSTAASVATAVYVLLLLALAGWQTRTAKAWPRHARRTSWFGLAGTVLLLMAAVVVLNTVAPVPAALTVLAGVVVAAPMLLAALLIHRAGIR